MERIFQLRKHCRKSKNPVVKLAGIFCGVILECYLLKKNWIKGRKKPGDGYKDRSITHDRDKSWTGLASAERIENLYGSL